MSGVYSKKKKTLSLDWDIKKTRRLVVKHLYLVVQINPKGSWANQQWEGS